MPVLLPTFHSSYNQRTTTMSNEPKELAAKARLKFIMLVYMDQEKWAALPVDERNRIHQACTAWHEALVKSGHSKGAIGLQPPATATTLRGNSGKVVVT